jgi:2-hydroxychromene-2-carboxylate isomerase|tara:strand:- start:891 stop:1532 length:642 start_codon:yes stop_codon:yes gene_type:complete
MSEKRITVKFYFDYSCPWTYLGFKRLIQTATRTASTIEWKPVKLEIIKELLNKPLQDTPNYVANYRAKDLQDWASYCSLDIKEHKNLDHRVSLKASKGAFAAIAENTIVEYSAQVFKAFFSDMADIADSETLVEIAKQLDMDIDNFRLTIEGEQNYEAILKNTNELIDKGGYGSPTMVVEDQMFFGNDRMNLVEFAIGQASGKVLVLPGQHNA